MAAPTLVSATATAFTAATKTLTLSGISVQSGDVLELFATANNNDDVPFGTPSGGASSWTLQQSSTSANNASSYLWTGSVGSSGTVSISVTKNAANDNWGFVVRVWRGSGGVGASAKAVGQSTARVSITTTAADSAVGVGAGDWNGNTGATNWGTGGTEDVAFVASGSFAVHSGHYADIVSAGAVTVGTSTPTGEKATVLAVEILGAGAGSVSGSGAITEGADSVSATGALATSGTSAITEGVDSVAGSGALATSGTAAILEGSDSAAGTGALAANGSAAILEGVDSASGTGALAASGSGAILEGADTVSGSGTAASSAVGIGAITEDADSVSGSGALAVSGSCALIEGIDIPEGIGSNGAAVAGKPRKRRFYLIEDGKLLAFDTRADLKAYERAKEPPRTASARKRLAVKARQPAYVVPIAQVRSAAREANALPTFERLYTERSAAALAQEFARWQQAQLIATRMREEEEIAVALLHLL